MSMNFTSPETGTAEFVAATGSFRFIRSIPVVSATTGPALPANINNRLVHAGVFAAFNPSAHTKEFYRQLTNSRE